MMHSEKLLLTFADFPKANLHENTLHFCFAVSMVIGDYNTDEIGVCVLDTEIFRNQIVVASPDIR